MGNKIRRSRNIKIRIRMKYSLVQNETEIYFASTELVENEKILFQSDSIPEVLNEWEKYRQS